MPKDFYNILTLFFLREMNQASLLKVGTYLLENDAEVCAINTFSGIMNSDEWNQLIQPMIKKHDDNIFGLMAVANSLGWGNIRIVEHEPWEKLCIESVNGYEAEAISIDGKLMQSKCPMLGGVSSGMMELIYVDGEFDNRVGAFSTSETMCQSLGDPFCRFETSIANKVS